MIVLRRRSSGKTENAGMKTQPSNHVITRLVYSDGTHKILSNRCNYALLSNRISNAALLTWQTNIFYNNNNILRTRLRSRLHDVIMTSSWRHKDRDQDSVNVLQNRDFKIWISRDVSRSTDFRDQYLKNITSWEDSLRKRLIACIDRKRY